MVMRTLRGMEFGCLLSVFNMATEHAPKRLIFGKPMRIYPLVDAACCIANDNEFSDGTEMFDVETHFYNWVRVYVRERLEKIRADKRNVRTSQPAQ